jgi:hypothetical protein
MSSFPGADGIVAAYEDQLAALERVLIVVGSTNATGSEGASDGAIGRSGRRGDHSGRGAGGTGGACRVSGSLCIILSMRRPIAAIRAR